MRGCVSIKYSCKREFECPICEKHFDNMRTANRIKSRVKIVKMTLQTLLSCLIMEIFYREYDSILPSTLFLHCFKFDGLSNGENKIMICIVSV